MVKIEDLKLIHNAIWGARNLDNSIGYDFVNHIMSQLGFTKRKETRGNIFLKLEFYNCIVRNGEMFLVNPIESVSYNLNDNTKRLLEEIYKKGEKEREESTHKKPCVSVAKKQPEKTNKQMNDEAEILALEKMMKGES